MPGAGVALVAAASLVFMGVGLWHGRRTVRAVEDYISARGRADVAVGTASMVATALGIWILFSPPEVGTFGGATALVGYALGSAAPVAAFIWVGRRLRQLMPQGHSLTEYVWHRYGTAMYAFTVAVMVFYMFIFLAAELTGTALAVQSLTGTGLALAVLAVGVPTLIYTAYGGLPSVLVTDFLQFVFVVPLLVVAFVVAVIALGGPQAVIAQVHAQAPQLLAPGFRTGIETGVALVLAILAANLFHQGYWQRVWTAKDERVLWQSFGLAAVLIIPMVFVAGLFGVMAQGLGMVTHPSAALFDVVGKVFPQWGVLAVLLLGVALAASSIDSLLNGLVSAFSADLHRLRPDQPASTLLRRSRRASLVIGLAAIAVATRGYSVLYLFLIADLVASAAAVPVFAGLFARRYAAGDAVAAALGGLIAGALFFPRPDFTGWLPVPLAGNLMVSFLAAWLVSSALVGALTALRAWRRRGPQFDFARLGEVRTIEG